MRIFNIVSSFIVSLILTLCFCNYKMNDDNFMYVDVKYLETRLVEV